jgi:hypothetical protein
MSEDELFEAFAEAGLLRGTDGMWLDDEGAVGAMATNAGAFVGWVAVSWTGPADPVRRLCAVIHVPRGLEDSVARAVERVRARREASLRSCRYCGERNIPGHMHSKDVCQSCAERHLGVVH